jgi:peptidoglycan/xylan/chitin deacetylase (PgdA/CDA1 family)
MPARLVKLLISSLLWCWDRTVKGLFGWAADPSGVCVVLYYHSVPNEAKRAFSRQMDVLVKNARPISATARISLDPGVSHAAVTFDDAFCSYARNAVPELIRRRIPSTVFVPAGCLGEEPAWESRQDSSWRGEAVMTAGELQALAATGWVSVGSHGWRHRDMAALSDADLRAELLSSKELLEKVVGAPVSSMSFPYGSFGPRETSLAANLGYDFIYCSQQAMLRGELRPGLIGRVSAAPTDWMIEFKLKLAGAYRWVAAASRLKRRLKQQVARPSP